MYDKLRTVRAFKISAALSFLCVATAAFVCTPKQQQDAGKYANAYASSLKAIHDTVDSALVSGKLTQEEKMGVYSALLRANEAGLHLNAAIRATAAAPNNTAAVQAALAEARAAINDGVAAIKNPETKQQVLLLVQAIETTFNAISATYKLGGQ